MLNKQSKLSELVNEISVAWFKKTSLDKTNELRNEISKITEQIPMLNETGVTDQEIQKAIDSILEDVSFLKTISEIKTYCEKNGFNANDILFDDNKISFERIHKFLQSGESLVSTLVKVQIGGAFSAGLKIINKIQEIAKKLGEDTLLGDINQEDLNYLLNKTIEQWVNEITGFMSNNKGDFEDILIEFEQVKNSQNWEEKQKAIGIIYRFFINFKANAVFGDLETIEDLKDSNNQSEILAYSKVFGAISSLVDLISLNKLIMDEFTKIAN